MSSVVLVAAIDLKLSGGPTGCSRKRINVPDYKNVYKNIPSSKLIYLQQTFIDTVYDGISYLYILFLKII